MRDLHTSDTRPQWERIPEPQQNGFQKVARETYGVVTPANAVTVAGFALVISGLFDLSRGNRRKAITKMAAGRSLDLIDGTVAKATGTMSPLGEALDAGLDKLSMAATIAVLHKSEDMPKSMQRLFAARDLGMAVLTGIGKLRGVYPHPNEAGKTATFHQWMLGGSMLIAAELHDSEQPELALAVELAGAVFGGLFIAKSLEGIRGQAEQAFQQPV
jgi:phosphatidylglycerophosphate synthase